MRIPNAADWGELDTDDLDAQHAFTQFFGKSLQEAKLLFEKNALFYQEDLQSMPAAPFNFYAPALVEYLKSEKSRGDSDGASSFLHMFLWILQSNKEVVSEQTRALLFDTSARIAERQSFYDADVDIYGEFSDLFEQIKALIDKS
jgi:hypothetical protein